MKSLQETLPTRYAIYTRFSSDVQNDSTLESQEMMCRREVAKRRGVVVEVYKDADRMGWSIDREDFRRLREDALKGKFDALIMWKFDRLARDPTQATMIKLLFRHEYQLKLYCVEGFSEDDDNNPHTAMMEQMLTTFAAFYSHNLSTDMRRATQYRHSQGKFLGGTPPFGYVLATVKSSKRAGCFMATEQCPPGLHIDPRAAVLIRWAFKRYSTGNYSYEDIAAYLNECSSRLRRTLSHPFNREMVRETLQNKLYAGYVGYAEIIYKNGFRQSRKATRDRRTWLPGIHKPIISEELFNLCQNVKVHRGTKKGVRKEAGIFALSGLLFCAHCAEQSTPEVTDRLRGIMRGTTSTWRDKVRKRYVCAAVQRGYPKCKQKMVQSDLLENQVLDILFALTTHLSSDSYHLLTNVVHQSIQNSITLQRMSDIGTVVQHSDLNWENGFLDETTYLARRSILQAEIQMLKPVEYEIFLQDKDFLKNFRTHWERFTDLQKRKDLLAQIIEKVIVRDKEVVEITLRGGIVLPLDREIL